MSPFVNWNAPDNPENKEQLDMSKLDIDMISSNKFSLSPPEGAIFEDEEEKNSFDSKLIYVGIAVATACFSLIIYYAFFDSKAVPIDELPVIKADYKQMKEHPVAVQSNITHQDKKIYTYIQDEDNSHSSENVKPTINHNPSIVSASDIDKTDFTEKDKRLMLKAFEDLSSEGKNKKNDNVNNEKNVDISDNTQTQTNEIKEPKRRANSKLGAFVNEQSERHAKKSLKNFFKKNKAIASENLFIQISKLLQTPNEARMEYNKLVNKHDVLGGLPYVIARFKTGSNFKYKIMIGPFTDKQKADITAEKIRKSGINTIW